MAFFHILPNAKIRFEVGIARLNSAGHQMEQRFFPSSQAQITVGYPFDLGKRVAIHPSLAVGWDNYSFAQDVYLKHNGTQTTLLNIDDREGLRGADVLSSRLQNTYLGGQLEFAFLPFQSPAAAYFFVSAGGYLHYLFSSDQRLRYELEGAQYIRKEEASFNVEPLQYGAVFRVGWGSFSIYYQMGLNRLFDETNGPEPGRDATTYRIGIGLGSY